MARVRRLSSFPTWPRPFDPRAELDWSDPAFSRRLLAEHLDQSHDGASRRRTLVERHVRRLVQLLPEPPARVLDAGCGPGLYAIRLARLGYQVDGIDIGPAVIRHARREARAEGVARQARFEVADVRELTASTRYGAALLIYYVLENLTARGQLAALRRLRASLLPGGRLIAEFRLRPDQLPGRLSAWEVTDWSLLGSRRQLLLSDSVYDRARNLFVLREVAVFGDGSLAVQQTTSRLLAFDEIEALLGRAGLRVVRTFDGWTRHPGGPLSDSVLVVAEPSTTVALSTRPGGSRRRGSE
ncbi:MAG: class I SAM-dependent methyltransferase [Candidatus Dormibacteria bacterium]